ncbi:MAG: NfeD family protein [Defluviitaleaceae bacterium]|nr:NfeD family protein [Defluviitaleaceae bacterium]
MYFVFFGVGVGFIVISLLLGGLLDTEGGAFAFFKPILIAVFLTVAGGMGLLLTPRFYGTAGSGIVLAISLLSGFLIATLLNFFVIKPLLRAQNTSTFNKKDTIGQIAKVISPIPQGGYGKISFSVSGSVVTSPAKSEDGDAVNKGESVEITQVEGSTYFVKKQ